jgi:hypothetical protein
MLIGNMSISEHFFFPADREKIDWFLNTAEKEGCLDEAVSKVTIYMKEQIEGYQNNLEYIRERTER